MAEVEEFRDLMRRVRAGEPQATAQLVRHYEPAIRLAVHVRLTDPALRRLMDSQDICQSVLASFLVRAAAGQYQVDTPDQLVRLLATMARNKLINQAARQRTARRDHRHLRQCPATGENVVDPGSDPSEIAAHEELLREFRKRLSDEERQLANARAAGRSWQEIAAQMGGRPNALRMRLERALHRIARELDLDI